MKAALITGQGAMELLDFVETPPGPGQVTVEITLCGICGTEVGSYRTGALHAPSVCGHEWVGVISAVGAGVDAAREGERVVAGTCPPCGVCPECAAGYVENCRAANLYMRGRDALAPQHGGFAPRITVGAGRAVPADARLTDAQAAFTEPGGVAYHGVRRSGIVPGDTVVVMGGGPIGMLAMQFSGAAGAGTVVLIEPNPVRRDLAVRLGITAALTPEEAAEWLADRTNGVGADVVIEASGVPALLQTAMDTARVGGTVTLLSYLSKPSEISGAKLMARETRIIGANASVRWEYARVMDAFATGAVQVDSMLTRTVSLEALPATLAELASGQTQDIKVQVDPR